MTVSMNVNTVVVVGAGAMGSQIGMVCALAGLAATVTDIAEPALAKAAADLRGRLSRDVARAGAPPRTWTPPSVG